MVMLKAMVVMTLNVTVIMMQRDVANDAKEGEARGKS